MSEAAYNVLWKPVNRIPLQTVIHLLMSTKKSGPKPCLRFFPGSMLAILPSSEQLL